MKNFRLGADQERWKPRSSIHCRSVQTGISRLSNLPDLRNLGI